MTQNTWTAEALSEARSWGDPLAAGAVRTAFGLADDIELGTRRVADFMQMLVREEGIPYDQMPAPVTDFLAQSAEVPSWYDGEKVLEGEKLFMEHGLLSLASLLHASLPECYLMERGVHVLWMTQQLDAHVFRRLLETAQMVVTVMSPGGIREQHGRLVGPGVKVALKVRLMHETMRHLIQDATDASPNTPALRLSEVMTKCPWQRQQWGAPINQEDMAYTLLTFGYVIPRSLVKLGVPLETDQQEAIMHAWNVVGHVMGVHHSLMAHTLAEADALYAVIQKTQAAESDMAKGMTESLVRVVRDQLPFFLRWAPPVLIEHLCGPEAAKMLGVRNLSFWGRVLHVPFLLLLRFVLMLEAVLFNSSKAGRWVLLHFGEQMVHLLARFPKGTRDRSFELPHDVAVAWGLVRA
jgi:hypothetical protein